jgi:hypothetical protein
VKKRLHCLALESVFIKALQFIILIVLLGPEVGYPQAKLNEPAESQPRESMRKMSDDLLQLRVFARTEKEFLDPKNGTEISKLLADLVKSAVVIHKKNEFKKENYAISSDAMIDHLKRTQKFFNSDQKKFARWMTTSAQFVCMSCHTQFPTYGKKMDLSAEQKSMFSDFEQAEFLFASHDFNNAIVIYKKILKNSLKYDRMVVEKSTERLVVYYSRLQRDFSSAVAFLKEIENDKSTPAFLKQQAIDLQKQYKFISTQPSLDPKANSEQQVLDFALNLKNPKGLNYAGPLFAINQYVAGVLYEYLNSHPVTDETPKILLELAIRDDLLDENFFFSLADIYLRECIVRFPSSKTAELCYSELHERTLASFTGSRGTVVPDDVLADLKKLKKLIKTKKP